jgi:hypothetical protein
MLRLSLASALLVVCSSWSNALALEPATVTPPVVLQRCVEQVKGRAAHSFTNRSGFGEGASSDRVVGFDISFLNTTGKTANRVLIRVGNTDFEKAGSFAPNTVIAWRVGAKGGDGGECSIRSVRFTDGSQWTAPVAGAASAPSTPAVTFSL